jgi:hypothetical protein
MMESVVHGMAGLKGICPTQIARNKNQSSFCDEHFSI